MLVFLPSDRPKVALVDLGLSREGLHKLILQTISWPHPDLRAVAGCTVLDGHCQLGSEAGDSCSPL